MNNILFNNQVVVTVSRTPSSPAEGDTVTFTATPSINLPNENYSSLENYYFSYAWMVSNNGGTSYIQIGDNNPVLIINNISKDFDSYIYKVKVTVEDLDGFILTESGDRILTQMGEIIIGPESSSQIQTNYSNNTIFSEDILLNIDQEVSKMPVIDKIALVDSISRYDQTITDETIGEIVSGQATSIDAENQQIIDGESKQEIVLPNTPEPTILIIDDEDTNQQSLETQAIFNYCYTDENKSIGGGDVTISWSECKYSNRIVFGFGSCDKYNSLEACKSAGNCDPSEECDGTTSTIASIPNVWWKDDGGNIQSQNCGSLSRSPCPNGRVGSQGINCGQVPGDIERGVLFGDIINRVNNSRGTAQPQAGCETEEAEDKNYTSLICPYHDQDPDIDITNIRESLGGGNFPCCGGIMVGKTQEWSRNSPCRTWFTNYRGSIGFIFCKYKYYLKKWICSGGNSITLHSDEYLNAIGETKQSIDPQDLSGAINGISYTCTNGGSLSVQYVNGDLIRTNSCCAPGRTCVCSPNGIPQFGGRPIVSLGNITIQGRDNGPNSRWSINRAGLRDCVEANASCQGKCEGKLCCPVKTRWKLFNLGTERIKCNRRIRITDSYRGVDLSHTQAACDRTSDSEMEVGKFRLVQEFSDGGSTNRNSSEDPNVLLERVTTYYSNRLDPYIIFTYALTPGPETRYATLPANFGYTGSGGTLYNRYKYSGSANPRNFCGTGNCGVWYKVKGPNSQSYKCDDQHEEVCGVFSPGGCGVPSCDHENDILIYKIARISDTDECRRASEEYRRNSETSNYAPTVDEAIAKARKRLGITAGMICPEESVIPDPPDDDNVNDANDNLPPDNYINDAADSNQISALSNYSRSANNSVVENLSSSSLEPSSSQNSSDLIVGSPGSFTINGISISRDNNGNITRSSDNEPSVPIYHDGQHSYDQYGHAWYLPPPASADRELIRASNVPSLSMSELYQRVQES